MTIYQWADESTKSYDYRFSVSTTHILILDHGVALAAFMHGMLPLKILKNFTLDKLHTFIEVH